MIDERKREIIFPVRVVKEFGNIQNAESLLAEKDLQIGLSEPDCIILENDSSGEMSGILLDFGRELNASVRILTHLTFTAEPANVHITCGESVSEAVSQIGDKNATNDHAIRDTDYMLPSYSDITLNETGFRFVCIRLKGKNAKLSIKSVVAVAAYRDIPYIGSFSCSNDMLNKIYNTAAYTCHLCLQNFIWDGIKRDRLVWVGDMHPEMLTVKSVFGNIPLMAETLSFIRNATPLPGWMNFYPTYSLWWLIIVRDWYFYTGEEKFLNENKEYILSLTKQVIDTVNEDGTDNLKIYFLDWPTNETEAGIQGSRALLVLALEAAAQLAEFCNENELSAKCKSKAAILRRSEWNMNTAKQTLAVTALAKCCNAEEAAEKILEGGAKGFSTFMSYYLLKTASKKDMAETLDVLEEYYGAMLNLGATSFWEDFNIEWAKNASPIDREPFNNESDVHGDNGAFCYKGFRHSLCHGWASAPTAFLAEEVLGINILSKGCKKIEIKPNLGNLSWAKGEYPTPLGVVTVSCVKKQDGSIKTDWTAPDGIEVICD
ncbi:MAG: alpha-L-rhamnosidase [Clostridia bacterium]|nr:alpha-L-rhamnosidase [Clostridia bacterium]